MISKTTYARKPLAGIIPAKIVKEHNGITSSVVIQVNKHSGNITLQSVKLSYENNLILLIRVSRLLSSRHQLRPSRL